MIRIINSTRPWPGGRPGPARRPPLPFGPVVFAALVAAWWLASVLELAPPFLLPAPDVVFATARDLALDGTLFRHLQVSLLRIAAGFLGATAIALPLAVAFGLWPAFARSLDPLVEFLRHVPPLALIPLLILWLGIGEAQKLAVIILAAFFPIFLNAGTGIAQCDPKLVEVGRVCGLGRAAIVRRIVLPAALPAILVGLRLGFGYSWRALVGAELIAASSGLGYMIVNAENLARTDIVIVGILAIGLLGVALDRVGRILARRMAPWIRSELDLGRA
ncbi:MAG: ABC transporter permease [Alphaproteobacteria bacterium]|nr:ABC transporter permease [Alphaproteobacteria bacterium]